MAMVDGHAGLHAPGAGPAATVDVRSDLFSLGIVLYRLCTGHLPFRGPTTTAVITQLAIGKPPPADSVNPAVPAALSDLIMRLLEKDPANRPESARDVADLLRQMDPTQTRPTTPKVVRRPMVARMTSRRKRCRRRCDPVPGRDAENAGGSRRPIG